MKTILLTIRIVIALINTFLGIKTNISLFKYSKISRFRSIIIMVATSLNVELIFSSLSVFCQCISRRIYFNKAMVSIAGLLNLIQCLSNYIYYIISLFILFLCFFKNRIENLDRLFIDFFITNTVLWYLYSLYITVCVGYKTPVDPYNIPRVDDTVIRDLNFSVFIIFTNALTLIITITLVIYRIFAKETNENKFILRLLFSSILFCLCSIINFMENVLSSLMGVDTSFISVPLSMVMLAIPSYISIIYLVYRKDFMCTTKALDLKSIHKDKLLRDCFRLWCIDVDEGCNALLLEEIWFRANNGIVTSAEIDVMMFGRECKDVVERKRKCEEFLGWCMRKFVGSDAYLHYIDEPEYFKDGEKMLKDELGRRQLLKSGKFGKQLEDL